jgi:hypothetical protein
MKTVTAMATSGFYVKAVIASEAKQSIAAKEVWIASRSLSSGAHSRDPLARNDEPKPLSRSQNSRLIDGDASSIIEL